MTVTTAGRYGVPTITEIKLIVQGRVDDDTPLEFFIDGAKAEVAIPGRQWQSSYPFKSGAITELNLRIMASVPATSAPADTASPAPPAAAQTSVMTQPPAQTPVSTAAASPEVAASRTTTPAAQPTVDMQPTATPSATLESAIGAESPQPSPTLTEVPATPTPSPTATAEPTFTPGPSPTPRPTSPPVLAMVPEVTPILTPAEADKGLATEPQSGRIPPIAWLGLVGLAAATGVFAFRVFKRRGPTA